MKKSPLTHFDAQGAAHIVDVSAKPTTARTATATATIALSAETLALVESGSAKKGDVLGIARIAAIMAAKKTAEIIPLCHPLPLSHIAVDFTLHPAPKPEKPHINIVATIKTTHQTGVEMEALTAVSIAALTIYDMLKAADKAMTIGGIRLLEKRGGKSDFSAETPKCQKK